jgi:hypothetical protein
MTHNTLSLGMVRSVIVFYQCMLSMFPSHYQDSILETQREAIWKENFAITHTKMHTACIYMCVCVCVCVCNSICIHIHARLNFIENAPPHPCISCRKEVTVLGNTFSQQMGYKKKGQQNPQW